MRVVNTVLGAILDAALSPLSGLPAIAGLTLLAGAFAVAALLVVKATSNQAQLAAVKRSMQACLYEVRLFGDDPRAVFRALGELLGRNVAYLRLSLVPLLVLALPSGLLLTHMDSYYGADALAAGRTTLVKVTMKDGAAEVPTLAAPAGVVIETPAVSIPSLRETVWRISTEQPGDYQLTITAAAIPVTKRFTTTEGIVRRSTVRPGTGVIDQALHPAEAPVPEASPINSIGVTYPVRGISVLGWDVHWLMVFFALSMVFALALRSRLNVVI